MSTVPFLKIAGGSAILALLFVVYLARYVLSKPQGNETMAGLSRKVQLGALAFLKKEYTYVSAFVIVIAFAFAGDRHH